ncbi:MAG: phosphoglycerate kinase [Candidatus Zixiibacteriota bacterium]
MTSLQDFAGSLRRIYVQDAGLNELSLEAILDPVPRIDELALERGARVLMRCDLDVPLANGVVADDSRLRAILPGVSHAVEQGWIPILMGHLGRDPDNTLKPVANALSEALQTNVRFIPDWIDANNQRLLDSFRDSVQEFEPGQVVVLENTRKYAVERLMWKLPASEFDSVVPGLYSLASDIYETVSPTLVNEALAASNFDFSSSVLPLVMDNVGYGFYISAELGEHGRGARESTLVVFSGLKIDKLGDLEEIIKRGKLKMIISAGSLAMALRKARANLDGTSFSLGLAEEDESAKIFIPNKRIEQAGRMLTECDRQGIQVVLPVDFILDDGSVSKTIPSGKAQMDIGPETRKLFEEKLVEFADSAANPALFYNGVFGKFEDDRFSEGTRAFIAALKKVTSGGVRTYVGGGEGRMALLKYGKLEDVTHAFTAGGTILKSLGNKHIAYVKANYLRASEVAV